MRKKIIIQSFLALCTIAANIFPTLLIVMNANECTELGHARWRVHFLHRILEAHRTAGHFHTESWVIQEQAFLQQIALAEDRLHALEDAGAGASEENKNSVDPYHATRTAGALPSDGGGSMPCYVTPNRMPHIFSSSSLSD